MFSFILYLLVFLIFLFLFLFFFLLFDVFTFLKNGNVPFVPSSKKAVKKIQSYILENFKDKDKVKIVDLGSGDGFIVFSLAKLGYKVDGYELNPFLIFLSNIFKFIYKLDKKVNFYRKDFLKADLSNYDIFITYLYPELMDKLKDKLEKQVKKGSILISNSFSLKNKNPKTIIDNQIYIYEF